MTVRIELEEETLNALQQQAQAVGMSLDAYLRSMAARTEIPGETMPADRAAEEFDEVLDEFFRDNPGPLPALSPAFSRADIYADHD
jgi:hypothetical protein